MHHLLKPLQDAKWTIEPARPGSALPTEILQRYPRLPLDVLLVVSSINCCVSPDEGAWLLGVRDYAGTDDAAFAWDEYERMSLDAAAEDADARDRVRRFWDEHLPVFMSVGDGYEYAAIRVVDPGLGTIVQGREPEFEDASLVAKDFVSFIQSLVNT